MKSQVIKKLVLCLLIGLLPAFPVIGQQNRNNQNNPYYTQQEIDAKRQVEEQKREDKAFDRLKRDNSASVINIPSPILSKEDKKVLAPDINDVQRNAVFLKQRKTGLIKLLPLPNCIGINAANIDQRCLEMAIPGYGASYSFREREYRFVDLSDLQLKSGYLISVGREAQGFLVSLGNMDLNTISLDHEAIREMVSFIPATQVAEVDKQFRQIINGWQKGDFVFKKLLPVKEDMTYAMRSVAYQSDALAPRYKNGTIAADYRIVGDERADVVIVFRILRITEDGSATLLWKELMRQKAPQKIVLEEKKKHNKKGQKNGK